MNKVKEIFFEDDTFLPIYVMDDGQIRFPVKLPFRHDKGKIGYITKGGAYKYRAISESEAKYIIEQIERIELKIEKYYKDGKG